MIRLLRTTCDPVILDAAILIGTLLWMLRFYLGDVVQTVSREAQTGPAQIYNRGGVEGGLGLTNLRRRAEKLNGNFEVSSLQGGGTHLIWPVPYSA